ncbi:ethanolamine ammonia-lyase [Tessaracoccus lapidicaptus]|uniref:Ethanolamine ammonia-lyase large subunit n=1 Tax=Tessaracoccus lapidicaptus TaxID=1427523 RepID=A0A1C0AKC6_9ACTN|nr:MULTISPECIES: ethanolamine ammonia-lyase subunit EutB [Tessaracoccus]AQX16866.1 ethanolamine ammonia lyase large subunit [Tessaracoccus sp. T2.5-30]OCL33072.1 ethanolamine ammonia-lyase [Tessaracoccus lapidicaptus]VEP41656.1 Ethanolamine ammonia-lyase heavy chain [Tessaracoccus lapidicaptus]
MLLRTKLFGTTYEFGSVKELLAKANEEKSGDQQAGIAAESNAERVAARLVLAEVPLSVLRENPVVPYDEDEVTRAIDDAVNETVYEEIKGWKVGDFREWILSNDTTSAMIRRVSNALTGEMVAGVTKLMSNLDLILAGRKIRVETHCSNTMGRPGTLGSRNQPNHPTDSVEGIRATVLEGLSYGSGDSVIGINPADDSVGSVSRLLEMTKKIIDDWEIPTQNCVLAHVTTQVEAMKRGAPVGLLFQSLAGSQKAMDSFGISVGLMDDAYEQAKKYAWPTGPNYMYFETGQGAELSADGHNGADQLCLEARCYGLAKRYYPYQVNTVVGFIGPEYLYDSRQIARAGLEDHFMGKLTGIQMGCDVCYTNHAVADQNDNENLSVLLASAGCSFIMGVPMGDDAMLSYQTTSYHDAPSLRQALGLHPLPEFEEWMTEIGLWKNGQLTDKAGDASFFLKR